MIFDWFFSISSAHLVRKAWFFLLVWKRQSIISICFEAFFKNLNTNFFFVQISPPISLLCQDISTYVVGNRREKGLPLFNYNLNFQHEIPLNSFYRSNKVIYFRLFFWTFIYNKESFFSRVLQCAKNKFGLQIRLLSIET